MNDPSSTEKGAINASLTNNVVSSATEYTCGAGGLLAEVALIGNFVQIEK